MEFGSISVDKITDSEGSVFSPSSALFRNRIINGDMRIDQRNDGASVTLDAGGEFIADRFVGYEDTDGAATTQRDSSAPAGFVNSIKWTTTTADTSLGATQFALIQQRIEGTNVSDLAWGTASAKTVTLSFWVRSSLTGTFGGALANSAFNRSYPFTYSISVADTWEYKSVTIAGDTSGTWLTTNGTGIGVYFGLGVGSTYSGTAGSWAGAQYLSATGAVSVIGTLNATFYITGVQLEVGSVATPFERRPFGTELALCQRYYYKIFPAVSGDVFCMAYIGTTNDYSAAGQFPVQLRVAPSALEQSGTASHYASNNGLGTIANNSVPTFSTRTSQFAFQVNNGVASGLTAGQATTFIANNDAAYLAWSAEL
jgi:hypothetical protein